MCRNTCLEVLHVECEISPCEIRFSNTAILSNIYGFFYLISENNCYRYFGIMKIAHQPCEMHFSESDNTSNNVRTKSAIVTIIIPLLRNKKKKRNLRHNDLLVLEFHYFQHILQFLDCNYSPQYTGRFQVNSA
jgi:hypothetical protein